MSYTPFLYHSNYGIGGSTFKTLFEYLNRHRIKSCGIVDDTFFGLPEFIKYAKIHNIKPIIGARISPVPPPLPYLSLRGSHLPHVIARSEATKQSQEITTPATKLGGLVMTKRDYLCEERAPFMVQHSKKINNTVRACLELSRKAKSRTQSDIYLFVKNQQGYENLCQILTAHAFGDIDINLIKKHCGGLILLSNSIRLLKKLGPVFDNKYYLLLPYHTALKQEFPCIAANEILYVTKEERVLYKLMCKIKDSKFEYQRSSPHYLLTNEEFNKVFSDYQQAMTNNRILAESCNFIPENKVWIFPRSKQKLCEIIKPIAKNSRLTNVETQRIHYEYKIIEKMGFEPYFCLVYHLKEFALSKGIGMNVRGSAAASFILHILGLSIVNPLKYKLPFERFLNPQRSEPPDIDVDVEFNQRERLIQEIYQEFGKEHVAHISVINRFQYKARFRDTARAFGISPQELSNIRNHLGEKLIENIYRIAEQINNYPHYFSCHPSGIIITPYPVVKYIPLYPSPAGQITQFDKDGIGMVGLVKIDILGVRGFPQLYRSKENIDFNDQNVYKFIGAGKTLGCFQIESPLVRQFLQKIQPTTLMGIANAIAVIRPGPARGGMREKFLKRLKREEKIEYPHPKLRKALEQTLGIPIYQEQILQIAHDFADFSLSDGDMLRRAMTKERNSSRMKTLEKLFFTKATKIGYSQKEIRTVWDRIRAFSSFGFNKAHSTTYATLAYLSAYQKLYNPLEFFCQLINNRGGYYPTYAYVNEARRWGIKIIAPDVNKSDIAFSVINKTNNTVRACLAKGLDVLEKREELSREAKSRTCLITGLSEIKNLSFSTIKRILKFRPFKNAEDFFYRVCPSIDQGVSLIKSGGLDTFGQTRPELYFILLVSRISKKPICGLHEKIPQFRDFDSETKLCDQLHTIGFLPGYHILEVFCPKRQNRINDLVTGKKNTVTGTPITWRSVLTKNKKLMSFVTIDDETGVLEVVIFPNKYKPHSTGPIMEIQGTIEDGSLIAENYNNLFIP